MSKMYENILKIHGGMTEKNPNTLPPLSQYTSTQLTDTKIPSRSLKTPKSHKTQQNTPKTRNTF